MNTCKQLGPENCRYKEITVALIGLELRGRFYKCQLPEAKISLILYNEFEVHHKGIGPCCVTVAQQPSEWISRGTQFRFPFECDLRVCTEY